MTTQLGSLYYIQRCPMHPITSSTHDSSTFGRDAGSDSYVPMCMSQVRLVFICESCSRLRIKYPVLAIHLSLLCFHQE